ncbi:MAG TPA: cytochrome C oxidase subunit IV family protein [Acidimicrobiales bacterium]|nr:cytochrome C oxidase subunit IV family protein [Acidimicrobiales bacterium]
MTVTHEGPDAGYEAATDDAHHQHHPSDGTYWKVGLALGIVTALEVATYFITDDPYSHDLKWLLIGGLLVLMVLKFVTIVSYFMHVRFDSKLFRNVFVGGLLLAVGVYLAVLTSFEFWSDRYEADQYDQDEFLVEDGA